MDVSPDALAGVVDLFGALGRTEIERALAELAFKRGEEPPDPAPAIADALESYHLLEVPREDRSLLVVGPTAFPSLPDGATDLPHIMDDAGAAVPEDERLSAASRRFRADAAAAVEAGDDEKIRHLLDVSYELEVWGDLDLGDVRDRLDDARS